MIISARNIVLCCLTFVLPMIANASGLEDVKEHEVERGETIESIAGLYNVTPEEILKYNSLEAVYTGMILRIPQSTMQDDEPKSFMDDSSSKTYASRSSYSSSNSYINSSEEKRLQREAEAAFKSKKYGKSCKLYGKLFKKYPKAMYVYNRGLSHYNNKKYRQAANDIEKALSLPDVSSSMKENGPDILADARKRHEIWQQEQGEMWGSLIGAVANVGLSTWQAVENVKTQEKLAKSLATSSNEESSSSTSSSYNGGGNNVKSSSKSKQKQKCGFCGGKGSVIKYTANYGIDNQHWCDECGKNVVNGHYHQTCTQCKGTGER